MIKGSHCSLLPFFMLRTLKVYGHGCITHVIDERQIFLSAPVFLLQVNSRAQESLPQLSPLPADGRQDHRWGREGGLSARAALAWVLGSHYDLAQAVRMSTLASGPWKTLAPKLTHFYHHLGVLVITIPEQDQLQISHSYIPSPKPNH